MKTIQNSCAQGDVHFTRRGTLPANATAIPAANGRIVITHSETGHDHVMLLDRAETPAVVMYGTDNPLVSWLQINRPTALEHLRQHDTHEPIMFTPGIYEVRRQREYTPEGFRRVED